MANLELIAKINQRLFSLTLFLQVILKMEIVFPRGPNPLRLNAKSAGLTRREPFYNEKPSFIASKFLKNTFSVFLFSFETHFHIRC